MSFRKNVAAVILNSSELILVGKRTDVANSWQLPQGGVNEKESEENAVLREIEEETGIERSFLKIISKTTPVTYSFPPDIEKKMGFSGQIQNYFLLKIQGEGWSLRKSTEFSDFEWVSSKEVLERVVDFKKDSYVEAFRQLFGEING
ncbi:MAG: NUDIX domain-containing protein [bacterium]